MTFSVHLANSCRYNGTFGDTPVQVVSVSKVVVEVGAAKWDNSAGRGRARSFGRFELELVQLSECA